MLPGAPDELWLSVGFEPAVLAPPKRLEAGFAVEVSVAFGGCANSEEGVVDAAPLLSVVEGLAANKEGVEPPFGFELPPSIEPTVDELSAGFAFANKFEAGFEAWEAPANIVEAELGADGAVFAFPFCSPPC